MLFLPAVGDVMDQASDRAYGLGLSRDAHIAFAAAYIAILVTIAGFGVVRFAAQLPNLHFGMPQFSHPSSPIADRERPVPDPASPHRVSFYPRIALINRQQGTVVLRLLVLTSGEVGDANIVKSSGYPQLDAAALIATGYWRYLPAMRDGHAVSSEIDVAVRFRLGDG